MILDIPKDKVLPKMRKSLKESIGFDFSNVKNQSSRSSVSKISIEFQKEKLEKFCKDNDINSFSIGEDAGGAFLSIDENLVLSSQHLTKIPVRIKVVNGNVYLNNNHFKDMSTFPRIINGSLNCEFNYLKDFSFAPEIRNGIFVGRRQKEKTKIPLTDENYEKYKNSMNGSIIENEVFVKPVNQMARLRSINESEGKAVVEFANGLVDDFNLRDIHIVHDEI